MIIKNNYTLEDKKNLARRRYFISKIERINSIIDNWNHKRIKTLEELTKIEILLNKLGYTYDI